jgi:hypothetical protein
MAHGSGPMCKPLPFTGAAPLHARICGTWDGAETSACLQVCLATADLRRSWRQLVVRPQLLCGQHCRATPACALNSETRKIGMNEVAIGELSRQSEHASMHTCAWCPPAPRTLCGTACCPCTQCSSSSSRAHHVSSSAPCLHTLRNHGIHHTAREPTHLLSRESNPLRLGGGRRDHQAAALSAELVQGPAERQQPSLMLLAAAAAPFLLDYLMTLCRDPKSATALGCG